MAVRKPKIILLGGLQIFYGESCTYGESVNGGATWSVQFAERVPLGNFPDSTEFTLVIVDEGYTLESVPLVAVPRTESESVGDGESSSISGIDMASWKLSRQNLSLPSFRSTDSLAVLSAVGHEVGVSFSGAERFDFQDEDVKEAKAWDPVLRCAAVAALDWVNREGSIQFIPPNYTVGGYALPADEVVRTTDGSNRYTSLPGAKSSRIGAGTVEGGEIKTSFTVPFEETGPKTFPFPNPLSHCIPYDVSDGGFVSQVGFWAGDPGSNGKLITYWDPYGTPNNTPPSGTWPATHGSVIVGPPSLSTVPLNARLLVKGSPPVAPTLAPVDTQFVTEYDTGRAPKRPAPMWEDQLFPSKAWFLAHAPNRLRQLNRGCDVLAISCGGLWLPVGLAERVRQPGWPDARVESFLHSVSVTDVSTKVSASISVLE